MARITINYDKNNSYLGRNKNRVREIAKEFGLIVDSSNPDVNFEFMTTNDTKKERLVVNALEGILGIRVNVVQG